MEMEDEDEEEEEEEMGEGARVMISYYITALFTLSSVSY